MKFRKKPVVIEAVQWFPPGDPQHVEISGVEGNPTNNPMFSGRYYIDTLEGFMEVSSGDWVITGIKGEKYPCKPDIFAATYEAVS